jgi:hypothetical protein
VRDPSRVGYELGYDLAGNVFPTTYPGCLYYYKGHIHQQYGNSPIKKWKNAQRLALLAQLQAAQKA